MGIYINKGNEGFRRIRNSEYIDKSGLIEVINSTLFTRNCFSCITRSRRFGKTMAAEMLQAYYDHSCDSRSLFADLEIANSPSFEEHLNKYPVIYLDITDFTTREDLIPTDIVPTIQREVIADVRAAYPDTVIDSKDDLMAILTKTALHYGTKFIMIIDEWDAICREIPEALDSYVNLLRRMFKGSASVQTFEGVYMTGILPIKKYKTTVSTDRPQSALNNFKEYSMVTPGAMARYFGFTKDEVKVLAERHGMDFDELEMWYDGYQIGAETSIFNPNSVMQALSANWCESYWGKTASFETVVDFIKMNFEGLKDDIITMLAGGRVKVNTTKFQNDMTVIQSKDDVLTVLIHLGYFSFDRVQKVCFVPNKEVGDELSNAVEDTDWSNVIRALTQSEALLKSTLEGDEDAVARGIDVIHDENTSILSYNDENSLACVISLAYYYAKNDYVIHRELASGKGYADMVLIPRKNVTSPALVIELKYNKDAQAAISQIKTRNYPQAVADYTGEILLVGINYDKNTKQHDCIIEKYWKHAETTMSTPEINSSYSRI